MNFIPGVDSAIGGLASQRARLDIIAQNIANAQTTRGPDGTPYQRKVVTFESELIKRQQSASAVGSNGGPQTVRISNISSDPRPGEAIYNPGHPDADATGYVRMSNVNIALEMVDLVSASRAYEANLAIVRTGREMSQRTLDIGR